MFILKTESNEKELLIYWTRDGEHIFYVQRKAITKKGNDKHEPPNRNSLAKF